VNLLKAELKRQTFTVSRELEYFSEAELTIQTGYAKEHWWPGVVAKELIDNGLDACGQAGRPPQVKVDFRGDSLTVEDNGPGINPEVVERILDFSTRTSDKMAYVSPTRGAQGNALKTVLAIPYVLSGGQPGRIEVEAAGVHHDITISTDEIAQRPQISHATTDTVRTAGTQVQVSLDAPSSKATEPEPGFLQNLIDDYALFNPHATYELTDHGAHSTIEATAPGWRNWLPTDPTSPHWYTTERLETLIGCYVCAERNGGRARTVREFVSEFRGLSSTGKQKQIMEQIGLERLHLRDLAENGKFDRERISGLLKAMQAATKPVKPEALGILGKEHFQQRLRPVGETFRYACKKAIDGRGLPFLIETAFAMTPKGGLRGLHVGINWSVPLGNPLQDDIFYVDDKHAFRGLAALLANQRVHMDASAGVLGVHQDPVCLAVHLACPRFQFLDRGKGSIALGGGCG